MRKRCNNLFRNWCGKKPWTLYRSDCPAISAYSW